MTRRSIRIAFFLLKITVGGRHPICIASHRDEEFLHQSPALRFPFLLLLSRLNSILYSEELICLSRYHFSTQLDVLYSRYDAELETAIAVTGGALFPELLCVRRIRIFVNEGAWKISYLCIFCFFWRELAHMSL